MGFSRQEHWSGLPFPPPMHESEKWKWSRSVVSDSVRPHRRQPTRLLCPWDFPGKSTGVGCHCLLQIIREMHIKTTMRSHFTLARMATIKKTKCCQRCGTKRNFAYHCWDCEVIQPYGKQYGEPQKNLKYNYHILGIHPKEIKLVPWKEIGTLMFATLLLTIAKIWKQPNHPLMDTHSGTIFSLQKKDFPSGPVAKTLHSQCRGPGFNPWSGN